MSCLTVNFHCMVNSSATTMAKTEMASADRDNNESDQDESTRSYLQRIIDAGNTKILEDTSTSDICKEVVLTLLQCAARLYEVSKQAAVDLIQNKHTRALLGLGIQDVLCQSTHQQYARSVQSDQFVAKNIRKCFPQGDLLSTLRDNRTLQLSCRVLVFDHIALLCRLYSTQLQNKFDGPGVNEQFMFYNYITLSKNFDRCEKSWLTVLLPDLFQWEDRGTALTTSDGPHNKAPIAFETEFRDACDRQLKDGHILTETFNHALELRKTAAADPANGIEFPSDNSHRQFGVLEPTKLKKRYTPATLLTEIAEETAEQLKVEEEEFAERSG
ncbi:hypothetical protein BKA65DRAFT_127022 [Rhexocercosporidium sp. MPI-PUGE-AT-0058]|nr:hypothetical protein BKA65DRAFT_127022 [Rhexocercosporidium sp. MPI-PUGE-AT-0058]